MKLPKFEAVGKPENQLFIGNKKPSSKFQENRYFA
jgi:hypothetical protein